MSAPNTPLATFGTTTLFADRVVQESRRTYRSVFLSQVDFCALEFKAYSILMYLGLLAAVGGLYFLALRKDESLLFVSLVCLSLVFLVAYFLTRKNVVSICAGQGTIREAVRRRGMKVAMTFIQAVEAANGSGQQKLIQGGHRKVIHPG